MNAGILFVKKAVSEFRIKNIYYFLLQIINKEFINKMDSHHRKSFKKSHF